MTDPNRLHGPAPVAEQLLEQPRLVAGLDSHRQPVRLGETDSDGHLVGYIDRDGQAWESLPESIVAVQGGRLAEALQLAPTDPRRDRQLGRALEAVPDELLAAVARQAAEVLWLRQRG